jgi:hypothetical protein
MRKAIALVGLALVFTVSAKGDTVDTVAAYLTANSVLPFAAGVADELATNLMTAQADSTYAASEPDSLILSMAAVLRAVYLEDSLNGATEIVTEALTPLPFWQSEIAIDDRVILEITVNGVPLLPGQTLNFGDVPVGGSATNFVVTPEPSSLALLGIGLLDCGLLALWCRRRNRAR